MVRQEKRRAALLRPHRHRQLQRGDRQALHRLRALHLPARRSPSDVAQLFNLLTGFVHQPRVQEAAGGADQHAPALPGPDRSARSSTSKAGRGGRIVAKMNALEDRQMIERALRRLARRASRSTSLVRGICRLRPGLPGLQRDDPGDHHRRPLPGARAHLLLRQRRRARVLHRLGRLDVAQPRLAGGGIACRSRTRASGGAARGPRPAARATTSRPGTSSPTAAGSAGPAPGRPPPKPVGAHGACPAGCPGGQGGRPRRAQARSAPPARPAELIEQRPQLRPETLELVAMGGGEGVERLGAARRQHDVHLPPVVVGGRAAGQAEGG